LASLLRGILREQKGASMRAAVFVLVISLFALPASAQSGNEPRSATHKVTKILAGAGTVVVGAIVASKAAETTTVTSALGTTETSSFSATQLGIGLGITGVGALILWDGIRSHNDGPSTSVGVAVGKKTGVFIRRRW
jgi:hypothetical protein